MCTNGGRCIRIQEITSVWRDLIALYKEFLKKRASASVAYTLRMILHLKTSDFPFDFDYFDYSSGWS